MCIIYISCRIVNKYEQKEVNGNHQPELVTITYLGFENIYRYRNKLHISL